MEALREEGCTFTFRRAIVMLLCNLSRRPEGCAALLQSGDAGPGGVYMGMHFRRLLQVRG
jgi:hypothetical protein